MPKRFHASSASQVVYFCKFNQKSLKEARTTNINASYDPNSNQSVIYQRFGGQKVALDCKGTPQQSLNKKGDILHKSRMVWTAGYPGAGTFFNVNHFTIAKEDSTFTLASWFNSKEKSTLNSELVKQAMDKVTNPNILVNLVSRRVRQLSTGGGNMSRPFIESEEPLGTADTALEEIVQEKIYFEKLREEEMS